MEAGHDSSMKKKKIAFVYDAIYPYIKGGAERRYYEIAKRLASKRYEVHLYGMKLWKGPNVVKKEGVYLHGICTARPVYTREGRRSIWQAIYFGIHCLKLTREDLDIVDCCGFPYFSLFTCKLVSLIRREKLYSTWLEVWGKDYWQGYLGKLGTIAYIVEWLSARMPDEIISISRHTTNKLIQELKVTKPIHTIPVGIDFDEIGKTKESESKSDVIYVGRLMDFKHIDVLIRAIGLVRTTEPNVCCYIVGDGPERKDLVNLTVQLDLQNNITFLGFRNTPPEVYALMKASKVFALPSMREGFGIVVLEANACGIPVITLDHKDNAAKGLIAEGENGFVCQPNERDLADSISTILSTNSNEKLKESCINSARKYDWNKTVGEIEEAYMTLPPETCPAPM
jgi:glycosyltransferase involved in cell wall biosynthesis